jgi:hypothetical protein
MHLTLTAGPKLMTYYAHWPDMRAKPMASEKQKDTLTAGAARLPLTGQPKATWRQPCNLHSFSDGDWRGGRSTAEIASSQAATLTTTLHLHCLPCEQTVILIAEAAISRAPWWPNVRRKGRPACGTSP